MNWYVYRRARGALILILLGVISLLEEMHVFHWGHGWPIFLIGLGIILLGERLIPRPPLPPPPPIPPFPGQYPGQHPPYAGYPQAGQYPAPPQPYGTTSPTYETPAPTPDPRDSGPFSR